MGVDLAGSRRWRTVAASVAGTSHVEAGRPCADACAVRALRTKGGGTLLVAVAADGAGASERAPEGARLACEAILEQAERRTKGAETRMKTRRASRVDKRRRPGRTTPDRDLSGFGQEDAVRWAAAAGQRIAAAARSRGLESRDFSCTLLVALVDEASAVFFQIGDGVIVYRGARGEYRPALWPQNGEYANSTWFVTDENLESRVQSVAAEGVHEVALLTDGLQGLALRFVSREAHGPFFEPMFARLRRERGTGTSLHGELRAFLASPAVNQRTDDDKTLVLATRLPAPPAGKAGGRAKG
jgi:hypothetical protein